MARANSEDRPSVTDVSVRSSAVVERIQVQVVTPIEAKRGFVMLPTNGSPTEALPGPLVFGAWPETSNGCRKLLQAFIRRCLPVARSLNF
jgi:hypothetical protein